MAKGVITLKGREKLCKAHAGVITLPIINRMAFGNGGVDQSGKPIETTGNEVQLVSELIRKEIIGFSFEAENTTCCYTARIDKAELAGMAISEMGLFDEEGDMVAYKTFAEKIKDDDMEFVFNMKEIF